MNKKIEETAIEYAYNSIKERGKDFANRYDRMNERYDNYDIEQAFSDGANWMLKNQWISVEEKHPPKHQQVLVRTTFGFYDVCFYEYHKEDFINSDRYAVANVSHWMPIPEPPRK